MDLRRRYHQWKRPRPMRETDHAMIVIAFTLCLYGVIMVHSATADSVSGSMALDQAIRVGFGMVMLWILSRFSLRFWRAIASPAYGITLFLLFIVLFMGYTRGGATRWLTFGPLVLQPSELAKVGIPLALAAFLAGRKQESSWRTIGIAAVLVGLPFGLILLQPDLGTGLVLVPVLIVMLWWADIPLLNLFSVLAPFISIICAFSLISWAGLMTVVVTVLRRARAGFWRFSIVIVSCIATGLMTPYVWQLLEDYQKKRILIFLNPGIDPRGSGWNVIQSKIAVGSGQVLGKGFMEGTQKGLAFLPEQHTDFIFSVIGEELGWIGTHVLLVLFFILIWRMIGISSQCRSSFARILAMGYSVSIAVQVVVNVGMTIGLLPVTGLPLPLVSYGGSHVIASLTMIGIIQSLNRHRKEIS